MRLRSQSATAASCLIGLNLIGWVAVDETSSISVRAERGQRYRHRPFNEPRQAIVGHLIWNLTLESRIDDKIELMSHYITASGRRTTLRRDKYGDRRGRYVSAMEWCARSKSLTRRATMLWASASARNVVGPVTRWPRNRGRRASGCYGLTPLIRRSFGIDRIIRRPADRRHASWTAVGRSTYSGS